jgi:hypothetical protein
VAFDNRVPVWKLNDEFSLFLDYTLDLLVEHAPIRYRYMLYAAESPN